MSANIVDERIVEMQFDNKNFEKNVQESMNTIDKLNQKLKFDESKNAFSNLSKDAKKFDLSSINNAVEDVKVRFSGMQMAFNAAIQEIVHMAFSAGKQIVEAIAIRPIKSGLEEYQTYMTSIQTILSNTESKGTTYADVMGSLDDLNYYADRTIYNFTQMTKSIGSFTAAGVGLEDSTAAIKGIANLAAISGVNAEKASNSMYHFSQAMAGGYLQLRNWNGIVTAGMGGEIFQEELKRTARELGKDVDAIIEKRGSFRESLRDKWLDQEVLTRTLAKFTGDLTEAQLKEMGYAETEIDRLIHLGKMANDAATKVKDLKQLFDTLNEALQSGWTMSWRLILGDFYQAREALTSISNVVGDMISSAAEKRNEYLRSVLGGGWDQFVHGFVGKESDFVSQLQKVTNNLSEDTGKAFENIIKNADGTEDAIRTAFRTGVIGTDDMRTAIVNYANDVVKMSVAEREAAGISKEAYLNLINLRTAIKNGSDDVDELYTKILRPSARENFITAILEGLKSIMSIVAPIKNAFADVFLPGADAVYKFSQRLIDVAKGFRLNEENADRVRRIFKGLFSIIRIVTDVLGDIWRALMNVVGSYISFDGTFLEFIARIGDTIVKFSEAVKESDAVQIAFEKIFGTIAKVVGAFGLLVSKIIDFVKNSKVAKNVVEFIREAFKSIGNWIEKSVPVAIETLKKLWDTFSGEDWKGRIGNAFDKIGNFFRNMFGLFKNTKIFEGIQKGIQKISDALKGLWDRISGGDWKEKVKTIFDSLGSILSSMGTSLLKAFTNVGQYIGLNKADIRDTIVAIIDVITSALVAAVPIIVGGVLQMVSLTLAELKKHLPEILSMIKAFTGDISNIVGDAAKIALGFLIIVEVIKRIFVNKKSPVRQVGDGIVNMLNSITGMFDQITKNLKQKQKNKTLALVFSIIAGIVALVGMLILLAATIRKDGKSVYVATGILVGIMGALLSVILIANDIAKKADNAQINRLSKLSKFVTTMTALVVVLGLLVVKLSKFSIGNVITATACVTALGGMLVALIYSLIGAAKLIGRKSTVTKNMQQIMKIVAVFVAYIAVLGDVVKKLSKFNPGNVIAATASVTALGGLVVGLMLSFIGAMKLSKGMRTTSAGKVLAAVSLMSLMVAALGTVVSNLAKYPPAQTAAATLAVGAIGGIVVGLMYALQGLSGLSGGSFGGSTAIALAGMAAMIAVVGGIVVALADLPLSGAIIGVSSLAGVLGVLVGFIYSLQGAANSEASTKIVLLLTGIGVVLTGLGIACAGAGAGFALVAKGLGDFAKITHAQAESIIDTIKTIATGFIDLIPKLALAIGEASATIIIGIAKYAPQFNAAVVKLIVTLLDELNKNIPKMIASISEMTIKALVILTKYTPAIIEALFEFLHSVFQGLIARVPDLIRDFVELVAAIFKGISDAFKEVDPTVWEDGLLAMTAFGGLVIYLTTLGSSIPIAMIAAVSLFALVEELGGLVALVGTTLGKEGIIDSINRGGEVLQALGGAIGNFFGGVAGGVLEGMTDSLPEIGQNLSDFATEIEPFIGAVKKMQGVDFGAFSALASGIKDLASADVKKGIIDVVRDWLGSSDDVSIIDDFPGICARLARGLRSLSNIDTSGVYPAALGVEHLAKAYQALPKNTKTETVTEFINSMVDIGAALKSFANEMKGVSASSAAEAGEAAYQIASFLNKMPPFNEAFGFISGTTTGDFGKFKEGLYQMAVAFSEFGAYSMLIVPEHVSLGVEAGKMIFEMADMFGAFKFFNNLSLGEFPDSETGLPALARGIALFSAEAAEIDLWLVIRGLNAARYIAEAIDVFEAHPDFATMMAGNGTEVSSSFATNLGNLAKGIADFSTNSAGINDGVADKAQAVADALDALGSSSVSTASGLIGWLSGAKSGDIDKLQTNLPKLGIALVQFSGYALGVTDTEHMVSVAQAGMEVGLMLQEFPDDLSSFMNNVTAFGYLGTLGSGLSDFAKNVEGIKSAHMTNVAAAAKAVVDVITIITEFNVGADAIENRANAIATFGSKMNEFYVSVQSIVPSTISEAASALREITAAIQSATFVDSGAAESLVSALVGIGNASFQGFINEFGPARREEAKLAISALFDAAANGAKLNKSMSEAAVQVMNDALSKLSDPSFTSQFKTKGENLANKVAEGMKSDAAVSTAKAGMGDMVTKVRNSLNTYYQSFHNAGEFLARGFANGISGSGYLASSAAYRIGANAVSSLRSGAGVSSPSIYGYEAGMFLGQGFTNGITEAMEESNESAYSMGSSAVQAMNDAILNMSEQLNAELDTQPVIRPVLDLSNVQSRSHILTSLLSRDQAMLIGANVNNGKALEIQNGLKVPEPGDSYSFVQNNYSPKALSRIEIYRQTKNQFSAMKGLATES